MSTPDPHATQDRVLGRVQECSRCHRRRKVNAYWQDTGYMLCRMCSHRPGVAFAASLRRTDLKREWHV